PRSSSLGPHAPVPPLLPSTTLFRSRNMRARTIALGAAGAVAGVALWWRRNPSACPYSQRFWVEAPHPFITRRRLREILESRAGEDRKSTRLNSSHEWISYAVFSLKK